MANTPTLSLRIPTERQRLIRAVADRLKRADAAGDPSFGVLLKHLVEEGTPPPSGLELRLEALECRLAELEAPHGGHFGERLRAARERATWDLEMTADLLSDISADDLDEIERTGRVTPEIRTQLTTILRFDAPDEAAR